MTFSHARRTVCLLPGVWCLALSLCTAQEYSFRNFTGADGLGNLSIQKIYEDRLGFLWISTENGLFRYDGNRFASFGPAQGLPAVARVALAETKEGVLLVGAGNGLYRFDGSSFSRLETPFKSVNTTQGLQPDSRGNMYLATELGLFVMSRQQDQWSFRKLYPAADAAPEAVSGIWVEGSSLWFGCGNRLCHLENRQTRSFGEEAGLSTEPIVAIVRDGKGNLWVRVRSQGYLELPAGETRFRLPDTPIPGGALSGTPALDRKGHVLLGAADGLLVQGDSGWRLIDKRTGMRGGVYAAFEDRRHGLWMGTGGRGLTQWRGYGLWENYTSASGLPSDNVYEILPQPDGSVWAGTEAGLVRGVQQKTAIDWRLVPATAGTPIHSLQMDSSGNLWLGSAARGVGVLHPKSGQVTWYGAAEGLPARLAFTIRFDRSRRLWAATDVGVFVSSPPYAAFSRITDLPASWFWVLAEAPDGSIWAGGNDGLFALTSGRWQHWTEADGLSNKAIGYLTPDRDGAIWVGYTHGGGIDRLRLTSQKLSIQRGMQRPGTDGLIYFLSLDSKGRLWAGTEKGLDRRDALGGNPQDGSLWTHFDTTDGLVWDDLDIGGFAEGPDGVYWFGTSGGLSRFTPPSDETETAPVVVFTGLRIGTASVLNAQSPSFAASAEALVAGFAAPEAPQNRDLLFRYRLKPRAAWTETAQQELELAGLAPGDYDLEVQVRDGRGQWSDRSAHFPFSVKAPWYRSGWFLALLSLLPLLGAIGLLRIRSIRARLREGQLQRMVEIKTCELRAANEELLRLTMVDALTGLANRRHFDQALARECDHVRRSNATVSLLLIDVDHFKALNDSAGHQKGDEYLVLLGRELIHTARRQLDLAARVGGEEFAVILSATNHAEALRIAEALRHSIEALALPHPASPVAGALTVSIGLATATPHQQWTPEQLVAAADQALYRAKSMGRNQVQVS